LVIKPLEEDHTPGTVEPFQVSLVEPVACSLSQVISAADVLQTHRADVHAEVGTQALENLPQPARTYEGLMQLVPGATPPTGQLAGGTSNPCGQARRGAGSSLVLRIWASEA
jgi:hypothetical protein